MHHHAAVAQVEQRLVLEPAVGDHPHASSQLGDVQALGARVGHGHSAIDTLGHEFEPEGAVR